MAFVIKLLIQSLIVGLSAALGAALAVLRSGSLSAEDFEEPQASSRAIPFVWLGN
jgi:hypothetical protein